MAQAQAMPVLSRADQFRVEMTADGRMLARRSDGLPLSYKSKVTPSVALGVPMEPTKAFGSVPHGVLAEAVNFNDDARALRLSPSLGS